MSSINPNNINGQYPVAGQDNDSQGFRDNFTNIKNNFTFAYNEINDLQQNAILKGALSGGTVNNEMNYNQLIHAQLIGTVETGNPIGTVSAASITISWADGHFQKFSISSNLTISAFTNWPTTTSLYAKMRLEITTTVADLKITFPTAVTATSAGRIRGYVGAQSSDPKPIVLPTVGTYVFEVSTFDAGASVTIVDLMPNSNEIVQIYKPTANVAITANVGVSRVMIAPTGTIISFGANVTLPNVVVDGTSISISSNVAIQLDVRPSWNGVVTVSPFGNILLANGTSATYVYHSTDYRWFKV